MKSSDKHAVFCSLAWKWLCALALAGAVANTLAAGKSYSYSFVGDPNFTPTAVAAATPSYVLMGGGPDVDEAFRWMIGRGGVKPRNASGSPSTGGRFVVIRATGTDAYNSYIYPDTLAGTPWESVVQGHALGLTSVETLVIPSIAAANDAFVNQVVGRANAVFIAGGDQSDYLKYWKGTRLNDTLNRLMRVNVPIGGTSAGLAVLGQFDFAALRGTVTSEQALANPFNKLMTIDPSPQTLDSSSSTNPIRGGFITPYPLFNTLVDAHLDARDRMGRLVAFVARLVGVDGSTGCAGGILIPESETAKLSASPKGDIIARGIGVDVEAALLVQGDGTPATPITAMLVTNSPKQLVPATRSNAYFMVPQNYPVQCRDGKPLSGLRLSVYRLDPVDHPLFNLSTWSGGAGPYTISVTGGVLSPADPY